MTCKDCVHHETFHDNVFYCEEQNDLMDETDDNHAEQCRWFVCIHNDCEVAE